MLIVVGIPSIMISLATGVSVIFLYWASAFVFAFWSMVRLASDLWDLFVEGCRMLAPGYLLHCFNISRGMGNCNRSEGICWCFSLLIFASSHNGRTN